MQHIIAIVWIFGSVTLFGCTLPPELDRQRREGHHLDTTTDIPVVVTDANAVILERSAETSNAPSQIDTMTHDDTATTGVDNRSPIKAKTKANIEAKTRANTKAKTKRAKPKCVKGCPCGNACISCAKKCHK